MRPAAEQNDSATTEPQLLDNATTLAQYLKTVSNKDIQTTMKVSSKLSDETQLLLSSWNNDPSDQRAAIDSFLGDIYSGLQVATLSDQDRQFAQQHLRILSGLYGILRPLDGIYPYRCEMGYRLSDPQFTNLYNYWGTSIVDTLPNKETIIDLSAVEYGKTVTNYVELSRVVTPRFLTISPKTGEPAFVVVHAKIARGAFAHWIIKNSIQDVSRLHQFSEIGYRYNPKLSTNAVPVFVCSKFEGLGLSVRLT